MKKVLLVVVVFAMSSFAQLSYDFGLELGMPMGDFEDTAGIGIGGTVKAYYPINEKIDATGRIGYIYWTGDEMDLGILGEWSYSFYQVPIMAGINYKITPEFYGMAELGLTMLGITIDIAGTETSDSETDLAFTIGAGYIVNEKINVAAFYNSVMGDGASFDQIGIRLGYKFM